MSEDLVHVVSAVILRNDRILLTQRRPDKDYAFAWECPGGKVEESETLAVGLERELGEELGVWSGRSQFAMVKNQNLVLRVLDCLWDGVFESGPKSTSGAPKIHLHMFAVDIGDQLPRAMERQGLGWFALDELLFLRLAPGNKAALSAIATRMRMTGGW
jgi:8-oxo-dGTP pyrophosphatase MutT (NUDIX family)